MIIYDCDFPAKNSMKIYSSLVITSPFDSKFGFNPVFLGIKNKYTQTEFDKSGRRNRVVSLYLINPFHSG